LEKRTALPYYPQSAAEKAGGLVLLSVDIFAA
jgi:hypothetical protein